MLSGIGPAAHLRSLNIDLVRDLPGVGPNLQDHVMVPVTYSCTEPYRCGGRRRAGRTPTLSREPHQSSEFFVGEAGDHVTLDPTSPAPELQLIFAPAYLVRHGLDNPTGHGFTCHPGAVIPEDCRRRGFALG